MTHRNARDGDFAPRLRRANDSIDLTRQFNSRTLAKSKTTDVFVKLLVADAQGKFGCSDVARFNENLAHAQISERAMIVQGRATIVPQAVLAEELRIRPHLVLIQSGCGGYNLERGTRFHHVDYGPVFHLFGLRFGAEV